MNSQGSPTVQQQVKTLDNQERSSNRVDTTKRQVDENILDIPKKKIQQRLYSKNEQGLQDILQTKAVTVSLIALVGLYAILIFVIVALEELQTPEDYVKSQVVLQWLELTILIIFTIEIMLNLFAYSIKKYYKDMWLILDTLIILLSLFFVIFDLSQEGTISVGVVKVIQAIFRFLRIFLLIRKAQSFKKLAMISNISTPAEKIIRFLNELKDIIDEPNTKLDIDYCIDKISNNKLYEFGQLDDDQDAAGWLNQSQQGAKVILRKNVDNNTKSRRDLNSMNMSRLKVQKKLLDIFLAQHDDLYMNPFDCDKLSGSEGLVNIMLFFFEYHDLFEVYQIKPKIVRQFFTEIMNLYIDNPYHNKIHAFDVAQMSNVLLTKCKFIEIGQLDEQDISCVLIAAAIHDVGHPGFTNNFLINTRSDLAIKYNDQSVLEMYHPATTFELAWNNSKYNIFDNLSFQKYRKIRESIISMVLSTDMAHHASELALTNGRIGADDFEPWGKDKQRLMDQIVHSCDISNPTKNFEIYKQWTERLFIEFWNQGDLEQQMGTPYSYMCNRYTTNMAEAQLGFIDYVVKPTYSCIMSFLPEFEQYFGNLDKNRAKWAELVEHYKQQLALIQNK